MLTSDKLQRRLVKNVAWLFSGGVGSSVFASIEPILLARFLGVEQFGLLTLVIAYVGLINNMVTFKLHEAVVKYVGHYWELGQKSKSLSYIKFFYLLGFLTGFLAFLGCILLAEVGNDFFIRSEEAFKFILVYSLTILFSNLNKNSEAILRVFDRFKIVALVDTSNSGVRLVLVSIALFAGFGIKGVLVSYVIVAFALFVTLQVIVFSVLKNQGLEKWTKAKLGNPRLLVDEAGSFILTSTFAGFLENIVSMKRLPILLLGHFVGSAAAGFYRVATIFPSVINKLLHPTIAAIYPPLVSAQSRGSHETFYQIVSYSTKNLLKLILPIGAIFLLFANEIIVIFFGVEYQPAVVAMQITVAIGILSSFCFWVSVVELALNRLRRRTIRSSLSIAVYLVALFVLIPEYSYTGAVIAGLAPSIVIFVFSMFLFKDLQFLAKRKTQEVNFDR